MHACRRALRAAESVTLASQWEPPHHIKLCSQWAVPRPIQLFSCDRREEKAAMIRQAKVRTWFNSKTQRIWFLSTGPREAAARSDGSWVETGKPVLLNFVESVSLQSISDSNGAIIHSKVYCAEDNEINGLGTIACSYFISPLSDVSLNWTFYAAPVITVFISHMKCLASEDIHHFLWRYLVDFSVTPFFLCTCYKNEW